MADFTLSIPDELNEWLKRYAVERNDSKNHLIYSILDRFRYMVDTPTPPLQCTDEYHTWQGDVPCPGQECLCGKMKWSPIVDV
jgi:hypothetical protein